MNTTHETPRGSSGSPAADQYQRECDRVHAAAVAQLDQSYHRLLLPDAQRFTDVLEYLGEWDHAYLSHHAGELPPMGREIRDRGTRYIPETTPTATSWERAAWTRHQDGRNRVGPFCTVDLTQIGGPGHRSIAVRATDAVIAELAPRIVTPDDDLSFRIIAHAGTRRALVVASHGYIIGSHWVAYIDPESIPAYPYELRDRRAHEIYESLREAGHRSMMSDRGREPHERRVIVEGSPLAATIHADGSITRTWADGSTSHESA
jgi:hypothetical protein